MSTVGSEESVLAVFGDVDMSTAPLWQERLATALGGRPPVLVVDLAEVTFMDSSGINFLVTARKRADAQNTRVLLRHPPPQVDRLLDINGIRCLF